MRTITSRGFNFKLIFLSFTLALGICSRNLMAQDSYEPNNNFGQAATLPLSGSISCSIHQQGDLDYFKFTISQSGVVSLTVPVNSTGLRLRIRIYQDDSNTLLAENIANSQGGTVTTEAILPTGNYYVILSDYNNGSSSSNYTLNILFDISDKCEWNNNFGSACTIPYNTVFQAKIRGVFYPESSNNDIDYIKTSVPRGGVLSVNIPLNSTNLRLRIQIYHENTTDLLSERIASAPSGTVTAEAVVPKGSYYIVVSDYNNGLSPNPFTVNVAFDTSDVCEFNHTFSEACEIQHNSSFQIKIRGENYPENSNNDVDHFKTRVDRGGVLSVNIPLHNTNLRPRIRIFSENTKDVLAEGVASQPNGTITTEAVVPAGTYFIVIDDYNNGLSPVAFNVNVSFDVSDEGEWNNNFVTAKSVTNNISFAAKIRGVYYPEQINNDVDYYKIVFPQSSMLKVNIPSNATNLRLGIKIIGENTQDIIEGQVAATPGGAVSLEKNVASGTYYILIYDYNNGLSPNSFTVNIGNPSSPPPPNCTLPTSYTLSTTNITPTTATLNSGMSGFSSYEFNYRSVGSSNWATIETTNGSMLIVNLVASTQYEFRVRVKCADNTWSDWTGNEVFSTSGSGTNTCVLPQVYTLSTSNITKNSAILNSGLSGFSQYEFNYRKVGGNTWETISSVNSTIALSNLSSSTPYEFRVRVRCINLEWSTFTGNEPFTTLADGGSSNSKTHLYLSTSRASATDTARITVRANNFKDIGGFQFSVAIPSSKAKIVGIDNAAAFSGLLLRQETPERWGFIWYDPNLAAKTLPDSSVLVTLKVVFNTNVAENECVPIVFDINPTDIVISTLINQEVGEYIPSTANGEVCLLSTAKLKGKITNTAGLGVNAVRVNIGGKISTTNDKGEYEVPQLLRGRTYVIKPLKTGSNKNGVNVVDVVTIRQHILGDKTFADPYRYIVSDVNGSGSVNVADVVIIQQLILGQIDSFSRNWVFVPANYRFSSPAAAIKEKFPEEITITNLDGDKNEQNFIGLKMGDTNNSASPKGRFANPPGWVMPALTLQAGEQLNIPVYALDLEEIRGFQCQVRSRDVDQLEIVGVVAGEQTLLKPKNFNLSQLSTGAINVLWVEALQSELGLKDDRPLFFLKVRAKTQQELSNLLYFDQSDFENQFVDAALDWREGSLSFSQSTAIDVVNGQRIMHYVYPNPSKNEANLLLITEISTASQVEILDLSGRMIQQYWFEIKPGLNRLPLNDLSNETNGVYLYRLKIEGQKLNGQFLILHK